MISLKQKELLEWEQKNFGEQPLYRYILGMTEEIGEIAHHMLHGEKGIRGGVNGMEIEQVADGVADTVIFGIGLLTALGLDAEQILEKTINDVLNRNWIEDPEKGKKDNGPKQMNLFNFDTD